jgi:phosphatidylinositol kinase/protein kinase (PI-3  family)
MTKRRDLRLSEYEISSDKYRELLYFCRQYDELKDKLLSCYDTKAVRLSDMPKSGRISNTTEHNALTAEKLSKSISLIEQTAIEADAELYQFIIDNVAHGTPYEYLRNVCGIPCGRGKFYLARRRFFFLLAKKK